MRKVEGSPNILSYTLPDGYKLMGQDSTGKARLAAAGSITCNCTQGRGCSPYVASLLKNQSIGCAMTGNCTKCTQTIGARLGVVDEEITEAEIINFNQPIHFITTQNEFNTTVSPSKTMMQIEEVRKNIVAFAKGYQIDDLEALNKSTSMNDIPSNYTYVHVNLYGRLIMLPVQTNLTLSASPLVNELLRNVSTSSKARVATVYKCKCNSGTSGCSLNNGSYLFAKAIYCDSGSCSSCTLSWL